MRLLTVTTALALALPLAARAELDRYDLSTNAPLAHVYRAGVVADAAAPGFVKYIRDANGRWSLGKTEDGRPAALIPGVQGNLWIPVGPELAGQKLVLEAIIRPIGSDQRLDPFVNDQKAGNATVEDGKWQTLRIEIPDGLVKEGLTKVRLHFRRSVDHKGFKTAAAIRAVRIARADAPPLPESEAELAAALRIADGKAVQLADGGGLDYYVTPPKGARVRGTAQGGEAEVFAQLDGKAPQRLGGGSQLDVSLDAMANKPVRLMLRGKGGAVKLAEGRVDAGTVSAPTVKKPKYAIVWLIDTLRADKLSFYDIPNANKRAKVNTPNLAAFAKEATVFEPYWVQGNESKASHASLFTGTYPVVHRVFTEEAKLPDSHTTIAEAFKAAGYKTGGFVSNGYVSDRWNFDQGFMEFKNFIREGTAHNAAAITKHALPWIDKNKDKPFYLYLGTSDPHVTYRAHDQFIAQYDKGEYGGSYKKYLSGQELGRLKGQKSPPKDRDRKRIEALYENEIAFNDYHFGKLVEHLKAAGIYDETMIIVTSDHGDEFWEHGSCGHGHNLHQELVNVPLVVRFPGVFPAKTVRAGADGVDVLPTILKLLDKPLPGDVQGAELLTRVYTDNGHPHAIIASQGTGTYALQVGPAKVVFRSEASIQAYDTVNDPAELQDAFASRPVLTLAALDPLTVFLSRADKWKKSKWGSPNNLKAALD